LFPGCGHRGTGGPDVRAREEGQRGSGKGNGQEEEVRISFKGSWESKDKDNAYSSFPLPVVKKPEGQITAAIFNNRVLPLESAKGEPERNQRKSRKTLRL